MPYPIQWILSLIFVVQMYLAMLVLAIVFTPFAMISRVYAYAALRILRPNVKRLVEAMQPQDQEVEAEIEDTAADPVAPPESPVEGNPPEEPEPETRQPVKKRGWAAKKRRRRH